MCNAPVAKKNPVSHQNKSCKEGTTNPCFALVKVNQSVHIHVAMRYSCTYQHTYYYNYRFIFDKGNTQKIDEMIDYPQILNLPVTNVSCNYME